MGEQKSLVIVKSKKEFERISSGKQSEIALSARPYWANRLVYGSGSRGGYNHFDVVEIKNEWDKSQSVICEYIATSIVMKYESEYCPLGSYYIIMVGRVQMRNGVRVGEMLVPGTYAQVFSRDNKELFESSDIENILVCFSNYVIPDVGPMGDPHTVRVGLFCDMFSEQIKSCERIVVLEAFTNFLCKMTLFSVEELFRTNASSRIF